MIPARGDIWSWARGDWPVHELPCSGRQLTAGWRNELYAIYCDPSSSGFKPADQPWGNAAFACERAACAIFGFATFGVHMTGGLQLRFLGAQADEIQRTNGTARR